MSQHNRTSQPQLLTAVSRESAREILQRHQARSRRKQFLLMREVAAKVHTTGRSLACMHATAALTGSRT
jgi:hypothetical protein